MKKRLFLIIFFVVLITFFLLCFENSSENIILKNDTEAEEETKKNYQVYLNDDSIYFHDEKGNALIYNFSGDKISEAFMLIAVSSKEEAEQVKAFYMETLNSGDVEEILVSEELVTIVYNDSYVKSFEEYTKSDIEAMLSSGE